MKLDPDVEIRGDGLVIRLPRESDADAILQACRDPQIPRFTRVPADMTIDDVHAFRESGAQQAADGDALHLVAVDAADGRLLGACGLVEIDWADLVGEVGYWTVAAERGRGVATRATRAVCRYAFDDLGLERIELEASTANRGSNAVARRLGFTHEGTRRQAFVAGHHGRRGARREDADVWGCLPGELT
jgi:RimJ/RimL family protein N-acetyltransferase